MPQFTVFCRDAEDESDSTIWISTVEAKDALDARRVAREQCADDWGYSERESADSCGDIEDIAVLGVVEGTINLVDWDDSGLEVPTGEDI
jgi:hypothetical protein